MAFNSRGVARLSALAGVSLMTLASAPASAQTAPPGGLSASITPPREEINPVERAPVPPRRPDADLFAPPPPPPCPLADSKLTFTLKSVEVRGAAGVSPAVVEGVYRSRVGQTLTVGGICEIRDRLSAVLFRHGLLARVEVPEQRIADGVLRLDVTEARIVSVRVHGDIGRVQDHVESVLNKLKGMTPFDLDTAQRYLLLANDVPGVHVTAQLSPSPQGAGAVDLDVQVSRDPVNTSVSVQNTGSRALGRWSALGRADLNSFTPLGERTTLILYSTLFDDEQQVIQGIEAVRLGSSGLYAQGSAAYGVTHPGDTLAPLHLDGKSLVITGELDYPLVRLKRADLTLGAGFDYVDQKTDVGSGGGVPLTDDHLRVFWLRAQGDAAHQFVNGMSVSASGELDVRQGVDSLGASRAGTADLSHIGGRPAAGDIRFAGEGHFYPRRWIDLSAQVAAQYADSPLLTYEQLEAGNLTIGRGYDPAALSGDRGALAEFKGQLGPFPLTRFAQFAPYGFYDLGYVEVLGVASEDRTIHSVGAGLLVQLPYGLRVDVAYAQPENRTFIAAPSLPPSRVLVQISFLH
jgi:hemolysin activation/secretion protein